MSGDSLNLPRQTSLFHAADYARRVAKIFFEGEFAHCAN
jgi:hypothetical protein